ncbi:MAG: hypothetical protein DRG78_02620 [Epsilonproteobacteria bacterium]|nr:MAG: hypothetical protein DRG78_02620 [Campylobacterota bacterium]
MENPGTIIEVFKALDEDESAKVKIFIAELNKDKYIEIHSAKDYPLSSSFCEVIHEELEKQININPKRFSYKDNNK